MWSFQVAKKNLNEITDWGKNHASRNLNGLVDFAKKGNLFAIVPCEEAETVLLIRKLCLDADVFGFWVGFGSIDERKTEDFVVVTSEVRHEPEFQVLVHEMIHNMNLSMIFGKGLHCSLQSPKLEGRCQSWSGNLEKITEAYCRLRGAHTFSFEGEYDTSIGRARLEYMKKRKKWWRVW